METEMNTSLVSHLAQHNLQQESAVLFEEPDELMQDQFNNVVMLALQTALLFSFCIVGSLANILVFVVFYRRPALRSLSNRFVLSLVFGNLLSSLLVTPLHILQLLVQDIPTTLGWRQSLCSLTTFSTISSVFSILLIAVDRYYAVTSPLHYSMTITRHRSKLLILAVWASAFMLSIPPIFLPPDWENGPFLSVCPTAFRPREFPNYFSEHQSILHLCYVLVLFGMGYAMPLVVLSWVYIRMYHAAHKNSERTRRHSVSTNQGEVICDVVSPTTPESSCYSHVGCGNGKKRRRSSNASFSTLFFREEGRAVKTAVIVIASFLLCWTPYFVTLLSEAMLYPLNVTKFFRVLVLMSILGNAALTPLIYVYRNEIASSEAIKVVCWWKHSQGKFITEYPPTPAKTDNFHHSIDIPVKTWNEQETVSVHSFATDCHGSMDYDTDHHAKVSDKVVNVPNHHNDTVTFKLHLLNNNNQCIRQNSDSSDNSDKPLIPNRLNSVTLKRKLESLGSWRSSSIDNSFDDNYSLNSQKTSRPPLLRASTVSIDLPAIHQYGIKHPIIKNLETSLSDLKSDSLDSIHSSLFNDVYSNSSQPSTERTTPALYRTIFRRQDSGCSADSFVTESLTNSTDGDRDRSSRQDSNFSDISQRTIDSGVVPDIVKVKRKHKLQRLRAIDIPDSILLEEMSPTLANKYNITQPIRGKKLRSHQNGNSHMVSNNGYMANPPIKSQQQFNIKSTKILEDDNKSTNIQTDIPNSEITARLKSSFRSRFQRNSVKIVQT